MSERKLNEQAKELQTFLKEYRQEVSKSAEKLLSEEMPVLTQEKFDLYEKNGNRTEYQALYFPRRMFLAVFGMEAILEKEETGTVESAVLFKLCDVIEKICAEETWALPAHVTRQGNENWRNTADLFASETAQTLSELLDRLEDFLPGQLKDTMEEEVNRRVLEPYYLSKVPYAWWEVGTNNWTAVCAGSIGSAAIHLSNAGRRLPKPLPECLKRVCAAMPYYFQGFTDDGACMEGLQYYTYGMTYFANFAWELQGLTGENLFCRPDIAAFPAKCFFPDGISLSFSDGSSRDTFRVGLQAVQALAYGDADFPSMERAAHLHSDTCYRFAGLKLDWFAVREYLQRGNAARGNCVKPEPPYRFHILPSAQWCIGYASNGTGFACKGGHNGESHNHNDIGHLIYEAGGVLFLTDLGAGEYDRDYFSEKRYQALCNNSFGHSVPILNGTGQKEGERYCCTAFSAGTGVVSMEIGSAYSLTEDGTPLAGRAVRREISFDLKTGKAKVTDYFDFGSMPEDEGTANPRSDVTVTENLVTQIEPVVEGSRVCLEQNGIKAVMEVQQTKPFEITVVRCLHRNHEGSAETVYGIRWDVPLSGGKGTGSFIIQRT